jgi:hypothetical protein
MSNNINEYDYSKTTELVKSYLPKEYKGDVFRLSYSWQTIIPITNEPIKIMEIGTYHGANVCSYMKTYTQHNKSEIHCVDPYIDYKGYGEYKSKQQSNYSIFLNNISKLEPIDLNKIYIHRGLSEDIVPLFPNESFDIIFIDGNHDKKYVLEDAVLCFKKLKLGGWMVFDDMQCKEVSDAVHVFLTIYSPFFELFKMENAQLFIKRKTT